ncbi:MAG TPA: TetR/AcrR family transcriptional regulator, partial [Marmoricola sp.]|nr:TetR/AcrR family transcriptional regulator [Marmoricola sp.]
EEIADSAVVGISTLYRHFPDRDALIVAVLDDFVRTARENAAQTDPDEDPEETFRQLFLGGCHLDEPENAAAMRLGATSPSAQQHLFQLVAEMVQPLTDQLREAGKLRPDVTIDDVVALMRMTDIADTPDQRSRTVEVILDGLFAPRS